MYEILYDTLSIYFYILTSQLFHFFQISYNIICACYVYMFCLQRWAVYICLRWNKYHVLFCSVLILQLSSINVIFRHMEVCQGMSDSSLFDLRNALQNKNEPRNTKVEPPYRLWSARWFPRTMHLEFFPRVSIPWSH